MTVLEDEILRLYYGFSFIPIKKKVRQQYPLRWTSIGSHSYDLGLTTEVKKGIVRVPFRIDSKEWHSPIPKS